MSIIFAILLFSLLIFVHELGHFLAAKASGVQVNEFSMFMGPALYKKQVGQTLYSIRCIPIGGYCAMEGEDSDTESPNSFQKASWWKRLIILVAGSFMNFVAGILLMVVVSMSLQMAIPVIDYMEPSSSLVEHGGFQVGDRFLLIDGETVENSNDVTDILGRHPGDTHDFVLERNGQRVVLEDHPFTKKTFGNESSPRYGFTLATVDAPMGVKLTSAWENTVYAGKAVWMSLGMLLSGEAGLSDMAGPVGIVGQMSDVAAASETWVDALMNLLFFGGFIAINLAIMNLLPIPALDGGRVLALLVTTGIEKLTGKKLDPKYEGYIHAVGMVLLLGFMALIMFKDIFTIFKG